MEKGRRRLKKTDPEEYNPLQHIVEKIDVLEKHVQKFSPDYYLAAEVQRFYLTYGPAEARKALSCYTAADKQRLVNAGARWLTNKRVLRFLESILKATTP